MKLLFDIGNSRVKYCFATAEGLSEHNVCATDNKILQKNLAELDVSPTEVLISSVAQPSLVELISTQCFSRWQIQPKNAYVTAQYGDLELAYANVQSFGIDRWLAMIAARAINKSGCLVVDCGTATTLDIFDSRGQHLGGLILPGIHTMLVSLNSDAYDLPDVELRAQDSLITAATSTEEGILQGVLTATLATIESVFFKYQQQQTIKTCFITGGNASGILKHLTIEYNYHPDLVLQGLDRWSENL